MFPVTRWKRYFPLCCIDDVLKLFENILTCETEIDLNLVFISILLGLIESRLTKSTDNDENVNGEDLNDSNYLSAKLFSISLSDVTNMYKKFCAKVNEICTEKSVKRRENTKSIDKVNLKLITNGIFENLSTVKYKENCHSQSIYSFITENTLDTFGLAYTVVGICQYLGFENVRLSLSEDHAWIEYDIEEVNNNHLDSTTIITTVTADVAWTGKDEDKRCNPIDDGIQERSRLYLGGHSVVCDNNHMIAAAAITTINPVKGSHNLLGTSYSSRNSNSIYYSVELSYLKRDLLWICYSSNLLQKYPLALINLADLELNYPHKTHQLFSSSDMFYKSNEKCSLVLYKEAVDVNLKHYHNNHVYPLLSMANYFYQTEDFHRAMKCWRLSAHVISKYNYKSEDWMIYRDFFEIATQFIPNIFRSLNKDDDHLSKSSGSVNHISDTGDPKDQSIEHRFAAAEELKESIDFLGEFLCFFDFICLWEEGSSVPVLHEVWANKFKEVLNRFTEDTRISLGKVGIDVEVSNLMLPIEKVLSLESDSLIFQRHEMRRYKEENISKRVGKYTKSRRGKKGQLQPSEDVEQMKDFWTALGNKETQGLSSILSSKVLNIDFLLNSNTTKVYDQKGPTESPIDYENLNCENLCQLNLDQGIIDYFSTFKSVKEILDGNSPSNKQMLDQVLQELSNDQSNHFLASLDTDSLSQDLSVTNDKKDVLSPNKKSTLFVNQESQKASMCDVFQSQKMKEICSLIVAPGRLNIPAIKLPLTAQSQVSLKRTGLPSVYGSHSHDYSSSALSRKRYKRQ